MGEIITVGLDIAKNVFQVHAIDEEGDVIVRRQLRRRQVLSFFSRLQPCLIGMEACATSHYWAREIAKLGHQVRMSLLPPWDGTRPYQQVPFRYSLHKGTGS